MSTGWEDSGDDTGGERSADLCFFLCGGGPKPSWSDRVDGEKRTGEDTFVKLKNTTYLSIIILLPL